MPATLPALVVALIVIAPPAGTALYFLWSRGILGRFGWFRQAGRSVRGANPNPWLMQHLQVALRAEEDRHLRIVLIVQGTVWLAFWFIFGPELWVAFCNLVDHMYSLHIRDGPHGMCARPPRRAHNAEMGSHPLIPVFVIGCALALRPTDKIAMDVVYILFIAFVTGVVCDVRYPPSQQHPL